LPAVRRTTAQRGFRSTRPKVRVISGLNSSMLMDLCMRNITGDECPDADALAADIMQDRDNENIGLSLCVDGSRHARGGRRTVLVGRKETTELNDRRTKDDVRTSFSS